jgi:hypothetical protein
MNNKLPLSDGLPEILGTEIDMEGKVHTIRRNPRQHETLAPGQLQRVARLQNVLWEVEPITLDGWVDDYLRETNPEQEIRIMESVAVVYLKLTSNTRIMLEEKTSLYSLLCAMSFGARHREVNKYIPKGLPSASKIHKMFCKALEGFARP